MAEPPRKKVVPRVAEHVERLRVAGLDTQKFFDALCQIRDDSALSKVQREALIKLIAMESFVWYLEAVRSERIDRNQLREEVEQVNAAIKNRPAQQEPRLETPPPSAKADPAKPAAPGKASLKKK